jgi:hypothetical protein
LRWQTVLTLVRLEARALRRNRMACAVLVLAVLAAVSLRLGRDRLAGLGREVCYITYWERDAWVERLEAAAEHENPDRLDIRVVRVAELADEDGTIHYPPAAHSIQLRPASGPDETPGEREPTWPVSVGGEEHPAANPDAGETGGQRDRWMIWFWHAGNDPAVLWPYSQWFWRVTAEHFGAPVEFDQRISALHPEAAIAQTTVRLSAAAVGGPRWLEIGLVWMVVFFIACHLAGQSLAEDRTLRTIESVVVTPAGWRGAGLAKSLLYGALAVILGAVITAVLRFDALGRGAFWLGLATATLVSLGVGSAAGSWCRSVAAAGAASVVYVALAGALFVVAGQLSGGPASVLANVLSFERSLLDVWRTAWGEPASVPVVAHVTLLLWACGWQVLGAWSYRRLRSR